jgi:hypothetical protein
VKTVLKWLILSLVVAAGGWALVANRGAALQYLERVSTPHPVAIEAAPDVLALLNEPVKRAQAKGKIAVIRYNLTDCAVCERVSRDVFTQPAWAKFQGERLEMTDFLMPTSVTSDQPELVQRIHLLEALEKASGAGQGFPFIAVVGADGRVLGARSGYHPGGPENYIRWIEGLAGKSPAAPAKALPESAKAATPAATNSPAISTSGNVTSAKEATTNQPARAESAPVPLEIVVKGISGSGDRRMVLLGVGKRNFPLVAGEKKRLALDGGATVIECREIGEKTVLLHVEGEDHERQLALP